MSCEHREDAGAWVLGALPEDEHERFAAHLAAGCEICRSEVAELQMVADTLPLAAPQVAPPPELKERIMAAVRAEAAVLAAAGPEADVAPAPAPAMAPAPVEAAPVVEPATERDRPAPPERRRRREAGWWRRPLLALRPLPAAGLATVLLALGVGIGAVVSGGGESARTVQAQVVAPSTPSARAALSVSGDRATLNVRGFPSPPSGRVYQVWVKRPGRDPAPTTALFSVRQGRATVEVPATVRDGDQVLVTAEPDGGSEAPTRQPVIVSQPA